MSTGTATRTGAGTVLAVAAVGSVLTYLAFFGWDREQDVDPVTGSVSGPYATWQVVGATVAVVLIAAWGGRVGRPWLTAAVSAVAFTAAWSVGAATAPSEDADLWAVGAAATGLGVFVSNAVVALLARRVAGTR